MEDFNLLAPLLLAIVGLLAGAILKSILKRTGFPYTVGLFVFGLLIGLLNRFHYFDFMPRVENAVATVADTNPDFILYVFLPILIFDAAYEMNMHIFKKTLANSTLLAVPGLVVCMLAYSRPHDWHQPVCSRVHLVDMAVGSHVRRPHQCNRPGSRRSFIARTGYQQTLLHFSRRRVFAQRWNRHRMFHAVFRSLYA